MALGVLVSATGCSSAKITDLYMARDADGRRRTECFRPEWSEYHVFIEVFSANEQTIITPILRGAQNEVLPVNWADDSELAKYQNFAPGKGEDILLTIEALGLEDPADNSKRLPLQAGNFTWEFYIDEHSSPDESIAFTVADGCP